MQHHASSGSSVNPSVPLPAQTDIPAWLPASQAAFVCAYILTSLGLSQPSVSAFVCLFACLLVYLFMCLFVRVSVPQRVSLSLGVSEV